MKLYIKPLNETARQYYSNHGHYHAGDAGLDLFVLEDQTFEVGETVKVTSGPLSDFDGEIVDVNADQQKLKVLVNIFERQVPVELSFDQVKKID